MPGFDGTGPMGTGAMTGGGRGFCATPEGMPLRRSFTGRFLGGGRGFRNWYRETGIPGWMRAYYGYPAFGNPLSSYNQEPSTEEELNMLKEQSGFLKNQLTDINNRINSLEKNNTKNKK